ncbi:hypothetical protein V8E51_011663 [Hyaloscypha variabilis]
MLNEVLIWYWQGARRSASFLHTRATKKRNSGFFVFLIFLRGQEQSSISPLTHLLNNPRASASTSPRASLATTAASTARILVVPSIGILVLFALGTIALDLEVTAAREAWVRAIACCLAALDCTLAAGVADWRRRCPVEGAAAA